MQHALRPCLWYDSQAEEAANFYVSIFKNSKIDSITYYGAQGQDVHGQKAGSVLTVEFTINGQPFTALNGGPLFQFSEAISFQILCDEQDEIDNYWQKLTTNGGSEGPCGWLKDRFGVSWQVVPAIMPQLLNDPAKRDKVMAAFMKMKKFDIAQILEAAQG